MMFINRTFSTFIMYFVLIILNKTVPIIILIKEGLIRPTWQPKFVICQFVHKLLMTDDKTVHF